MKKVGIVTLNGYYNFGNRLQNFALTRVLENRGFEVETIWSGDEISFKSKLREVVIRFLPLKKSWRRQRKFYKFSKNYMKKRPLTQECIKDFDVFVAGSDQVWNYESVKNNINYLIAFAPKTKKISYAASLGNSDLPKEYVSIYKKYLDDFEYISVREEKAKQLLLNEVKLSKNIEVVIDPTLLIDRDEWENIEQIPARFQEREYILCYFLGDMDKNIKKSISQYAKEKNYSIIDVLNPQDSCYCIGPQEFVYLIHHATLVCTDSFHSCVFSYIFHIPFLTFKRQGIWSNMYSRIDNFLTTFHLEDREYKNQESFHHCIDNFSTDYSILTDLREQANHFLDEALK